MVDAFRSAPNNTPAQTEKGDQMHKSFHSLLDSVLLVFSKYGFKEFSVGKLYRIPLLLFSSLLDVIANYCSILYLR